MTSRIRRIHARSCRQPGSSPLSNPLRRRSSCRGRSPLNPNPPPGPAKPRRRLVTIESLGRRPAPASPRWRRHRSYSAVPPPLETAFSRLASSAGRPLGLPAHPRTCRDHTADIARLGDHQSCRQPPGANPTIPFRSPPANRPSFTSAAASLSPVAITEVRRHPSSTEHTRHLTRASDHRRSDRHSPTAVITRHRPIRLRSAGSRSAYPTDCRPPWIRPPRPTAHRQPPCGASTASASR